MRTIIIGGTGLIGRKLSQLLAQAGHEIIVLSRNPARRSFPAGVQGVQWDGKTGRGWQHLVDGAHAIVNPASPSSSPACTMPWLMCCP